VLHASELQFTASIGIAELVMWIVEDAMINRGFPGELSLTLEENFTIRGPSTAVPFFVACHPPGNSVVIKFSQPCLADDQVSSLDLRIDAVAFDSHRTIFHSLAGTEMALLRMMPASHSRFFAPSGLAIAESTDGAAADSFQVLRKNLV
jgi:hypothetical protein